jgi:hypothetical protein
MLSGLSGLVPPIGAKAAEPAKPEAKPAAPSRVEDDDKVVAKTTS